MDINFNELWEVTYRSILSLATLFLVTKMLGKKQVSQLSLFAYVIGISIGNFAAEVTINLEAEWINGVVAVTIFGVVAYLVSILTMKSIIARRFFTFWIKSDIFFRAPSPKRGRKKLCYSPVS